MPRPFLNFKTRLSNWLKLDALLLGGVAVGVVFIVFFLNILESYLHHEPLLQLDVRIANAIPAHRTEALTLAMKIFTTIGNWQVITVGVLLLILYFIPRKRWGSITALLVSVLGGELFVALTKHFIARPRPLIGFPLVDVHEYSFPSGHSFVAFSFYGLLTYFLFREAKTPLRNFIVLGGGIIILLIGFSRIYLGVHWTSDVLGSFAAGGAWLTFLVLVLERKRWSSASSQEAA